MWERRASAGSAASHRDARFRFTRRFCSEPLAPSMSRWTAAFDIIVIVLAFDLLPGRLCGIQAQSKDPANCRARASRPSNPRRSARIGPSPRGSISTTEDDSISRPDGVDNSTEDAFMRAVLSGWETVSDACFDETPHGTDRHDRLDFAGPRDRAAFPCIGRGGGKTGLAHGPRTMKTDAAFVRPGACPRFSWASYR